MKRIVLCVMLVVTAALGGSAAQAAGRPHTHSHAASPNVSWYYDSSELDDYVDPFDWCLTADGTSSGDTVVLGRCANALTQLIIPVYDSSADAFELKLYDGWCLTLPSSSDLVPDGTLLEQGKCIDANQQLFNDVPGPYGTSCGDGNPLDCYDVSWVDPYIYDRNGYSLAIDDKGDVKKAYNPIQGWEAVQDPSQDDGGPDCYQSSNIAGDHC